MKSTIIVLACLATAMATRSQDVNTWETKRMRLPNGWSLSPAGKSIPLGDLPLNIALSSTRRYAAVTNNGQSIQTIQLIDAKTDRQLDQVTIKKSWGGLAFSADEKYLYASGGNDNWILQYAVRNNKLITTDTFKLGASWPKEIISPTGITLDDARHLLYVVTKENNALYVIDLLTHRILHTTKLGSEAYTCLLSPNKTELYISIWGADKIIVYDTRRNVIADSVAENLLALH